MKTVLKLLLLYLVFQIAAILLVNAAEVIYQLATTGSTELTQSTSLVSIMLLSMVAMMIYLWKAGYISLEKVTWSAVSPLYLVFTIIAYAAILVLMDFLLSFLYLPDLSEDSFKQIQSSWTGIFLIVILGPILEELMFRGAITKALLARYSPAKAIIISALVFGIYHFNPLQIVSASIIGLFLGWIYYKTASLIPCILIHIMNNGLSVYLTVKYPDVDYREFIPGQPYMILLAVCVVIVVVFLYLMNKTTISYPWKKEREQNEISEII